MFLIFDKGQKGQKMPFFFKKNSPCPSTTLEAYGTLGLFLACH